MFLALIEIGSRPENTSGKSSSFIRGSGNSSSESYLYVIFFFLIFVCITGMMLGPAAVGKIGGNGKSSSGCTPGGNGKSESSSESSLLVPEAIIELKNKNLNVHLLQARCFLSRATQ
uniref:(northern house mosquito) hypothetical protein n=1 Tax=Culex pipiens TaxID=7175 RepID=A0A8D8I828_CULPI